MKWILVYCVLSAPDPDMGQWKDGKYCNARYDPPTSEAECRKAEKEYAEKHKDEDFLVFCVDAAEYLWT